MKLIGIFQEGIFACSVIARSPKDDAAIY